MTAMNPFTWQRRDKIGEQKKILAKHVLFEESGLFKS
jgi:hypothetical protein